jgi:hypothetical protein
MTQVIWNELLSKIGIYMEVLFVLNSAKDKEVWQYVVGVAAHVDARRRRARPNAHDGHASGPVIKRDTVV